MMGYMSELDLLRQQGVKIVHFKTIKGKKWICTECLRASQSPTKIRHTRTCQNQGAKP